MEELRHYSRSRGARIQSTDPRRRLGGGWNSGLRSTGLSRTSHGVAWIRAWWARQSSTRLSRLVSPPSAQWVIRKMVDQKVVRYRGFSCHDPALTLDAIERLDPDALQSPINATRVPDFEARVLPLCKTKGIAVIAMKVVGHGFFLKAAVDGSFDSRFQTDRQPELHRFAPPKEAFEKAPPSPDDFIRYAMSLPLTVTLVGIDSRTTLDSVLTVAAAFSPMPASQMVELSGRAQGLATTGYWIPRR